MNEDAILVDCESGYVNTGVVGHEWRGAEGRRRIFFEVSPCHSLLANACMLGTACSTF